MVMARPKISSPLRRILAYSLDILMGGTLAMGVYALAGVPVFVSVLGGRGELAQRVPGGIYAGYLLILICATIIVQLYFWSNGTTMGKAILKMQIVNKITYEPVELWIMILRELFFKPISGILFGLGYLWVLIDRNHQSWHDKFLNTVVVENGMENTVERKFLG